MKIMIINGPNMNMLGVREPDIYGVLTYDDLVAYIKMERGEDHKLKFFQSNHEGEIIDMIQSAYFDKYDGIVINPAGYTHTSIAIMDAIKAVNIPTVEVHMTSPAAREEYRKTSYISEAAIATVSGQGFNSYLEAIDILAEGAK